MALLDKGAIVDTQRPTTGATALYIGAEKNNAGVVRLLLEAGATQIPNSHGLSPLHVSAKNNSLEVVGLLLKHVGKDALDQTTNEGCTPMYLAVKQQNVEVRVVTAPQAHRVLRRLQILDSHLLFPCLPPGRS